MFGDERITQYIFQGGLRVSIKPPRGGMEQWMLMVSEEWKLRDKVLRMIAFTVDDFDFIFEDTREEALDIFAWMYFTTATFPDAED